MAHSHKAGQQDGEAESRGVTLPSDQVALFVQCSISSSMCIGGCFMTAQH
jgi:hypothetical protein